MSPRSGASRVGSAGERGGADTGIGNLIAVGGLFVPLPPPQTSMPIFSRFLRRRPAALATLLLTTGNAFALNPICPPGLYIADPSPRVMPDGRLYVYGSRDEPGNSW